MIVQVLPELSPELQMPEDFFMHAAAPLVRSLFIWEIPRTHYDFSKKNNI
jgi:hypothetical protein